MSSKGLPTPPPQVSMKTVVNMINGGLQSRLSNLKQEVEHVERHLALVESLSKPGLGREDKMKMLFDLWDTDGDNLVNFSELAVGIRKINPQPPGLEEAVKEAKLVLVAFDEDKDIKLNLAEFDNFVSRFSEAYGSPFECVAEVLILVAAESYSVQPMEEGSLAAMQPMAEMEVSAIQGLRAIASDSRMKQLFKLFDRDGNGMVDFSEVALGLKKLDKSASLEDARARAVDCMLLCDQDSNRKLDYQEFVVFIQRICVLAERSFAEMAQELCEKLAQKDELLAAGDVDTMQSIAKGDDVEQVFETLADRKLHAVFELWDTDGDGVISFSELAIGLRRFSASGETVQHTAANTAQAMLRYDEDSNQQLDRIEFSELVNNVAREMGCKTDELLEHMVMQAVVGKDDPMEVAALQAAEDHVARALHMKQQENNAPLPT